MELLLYAAAFTLWQCTASVPRDALAIGSFLGRWRLRRGPRYFLFSPWPGDFAVVSAATSIPNAFSLADARAVIGDARRKTLPLRIACEIYVGFVFVALPAAIAWLDGDAAWRLLLPVIGVLHAGTLVTLAAAERRFDPRPNARLERWIGSALFPPALFRTPADLVGERLAGFHPTTLAAALLDEAACVRVLRIELGGLGSSDGNREAILGLCGQLGIDLRRVIAPERVSPSARSFCPRCLDEFQVERGRCPGCETDSVGYEGTR